MIKNYSENSGGQVAQARLDSKVDWLELNESAEILLLRDRQQHLIMLDVSSGKTVKKLLILIKNIVFI